MLLIFLDVDYHSLVLPIFEAREFMEREDFLYNSFVHFYLCVIWEEDEVIDSLFESEASYL